MSGKYHSNGVYPMDVSKILLHNLHELCILFANICENNGE